MKHPVVYYVDVLNSKNCNEDKSVQFHGDGIGIINMIYSNIKNSSNYKIKYNLPPVKAAPSK